MEASEAEKMAEVSFTSAGVVVYAPRIEQSSGCMSIEEEDVDAPTEDDIQVLEEMRNSW